MKSIIYGFFMGTAELLPGISGSTVALMFGIYDRFINSLNKLFTLIPDFLGLFRRETNLNMLKKKVLKADFVFLLSLLLGVILAFGLLSGLILHLFESYPHLVVATLLGLVFAALPIPISEMKRNIKEIAILLGIAVVFWVLISITDVSESVNVNPLYLFLAGLLGVSGMVLPGLSGSFILLVLGVYYYVLGLLKQFFTFDIDIQWFIETAAFGFGMAVGFVTTAKILKIALKKYRSITMSVIGGLLLGSVRLLNPFVEGVGNGDDFHLVQIPLSSFETVEVIVILSLVLISAVSIGAINISRVRKGAFKST